MEILKKTADTCGQSYPEIMTIAQVAEYLGCSERHCYALMKQGVLPSLQLGTLRRFRRDSVRAVLAKLEKSGN